MFYSKGHHVIKDSLGSASGVWAQKCCFLNAKIANAQSPEYRPIPSYDVYIHTPVEVKPPILIYKNNASEI